MNGYAIDVRKMTSTELVELERQLLFRSVNHPNRRMALLDTVAAIRAELKTR